MTNEHTRRELLRATGAASASVAIVPASAVAEASDDPSSGDDEIPWDLAITNNSDEKKSVSITVKSARRGEQLFSKRYPLQGMNNPAKRPDERATFKGAVAVSATGEYVVEATVPSESSDRTEVLVTEDGFAPYQAVDVYVRPSGEVVAGTIL